MDILFKYHGVCESVEYVGERACVRRCERVPDETARFLVLSARLLEFLAFAGYDAGHESGGGRLLET